MEQFGAGGEVSSRALLTLMRSAAVLDVLDRTSVVSDLGPMVAEIAAALRAAKDVALGGPPEGSRGSREIPVFPGGYDPGVAEVAQLV